MGGSIVVSLLLVLPASRGLDQSTLVPAYQAGYARARAAREARLQVSSGPNILRVTTINTDIRKN